MFHGKKIFFALCCAIAAVFLIQTAAPAEEKPAETKPVAAEATAPAVEAPSGDVSVSVLSRYIWRGYELSRNSIVVQPSATVGWKGFSVSLWGNIDTNPYYGGSDGKSYHGAWNEMDLTVSYLKAIGPVSLGVGYVYYSLVSLNRDGPDRADAQEIFASIGLNTILSPTLTVYKEIDHYRNWYFLLGISHVFELNKMVSLKLAASASYLLSTYADAALFNAGAGYGGYPKFDGDSLATNDKFSNFHDGVVTASLPIKATDRITVTPTLSYVFPLSSEARLEMKGQGLKGTATPSERDSSCLYGGLTMSFSF